MLGNTRNDCALVDTCIYGQLEQFLEDATFTLTPQFLTTERPDRACECLIEGKVVIFAAGTGNPYFSTDTAAVLRAAEIDADVILLAKNVDGVYNADPVKDPTAVKYDSITYKDILKNELKALDLTATTFCMDNDINGYAFGLSDPENIYRVVMGEAVGTAIHN